MFLEAKKISDIFKFGFKAQVSKRIELGIQ